MMLSIARLLRSGSVGALSSSSSKNLAPFSSSSSSSSAEDVFTTAYDANREAVSALSVIDMGPWENGSEEERAAIGAAVASSCVNVGFFMLVNHGVNQGPILQASRDFFGLDDETKMSIAPHAFNKDNTHIYRGYFPYSVNGKEGLDIGNPSHLTPQQGGSRYFEPTPYLPSDVVGDDWKANVQEYYVSVSSLAKKVTEAACLGLGLEQGYFDSIHRDAVSTLRFNHYPQLRPEDPPMNWDGETELSCETHTDSGIWTILMQDDVGGLQVQNKAGVWIDVPTLPNSFVVNLGLGLQRWTNDKFIATNHRVLFNREERFSIPFFFEPDPNTVMHPLPGTVTEQHPALYPVETYDEFVTESLKRFKEYRRDDDDE